MSFHSEAQSLAGGLLEDHLKHGARFGPPPLRLLSEKGSRLVFITDPSGLAVERYRMLRRRLLALCPTGGTILITSPGSGDGKSLTAVNLAWCLAESGHRTCLVDLDFRAPGVCKTLGCESLTYGTTEVLTGQCTATQAVRQIENCELHVLGIRDPIASPSRQLAPGVMRPMLKELRDRFDWVILDMAPTIPMCDVAEVLAHVDGAVMVVRSTKTTKSLIAPTLEVLGTKLLGVILNDSVIHGSAYYGHYGYGASHNRKP